ncbi:MAG: sulfatase [Myxococcota bacterium]|jgi:arylsulfatase A-like enzyme|nr:sulfatase [Myxococcota bacterium]
MEPSPAPASSCRWAARLGLALPLLLGGGEAVRLLAAAAHPRTALVALLLPAVAGLGGVLAGLLVPGVRQLLAFASRHPGPSLGGGLGALLGLRVAEAAATHLFPRLHRPDLAGLLLALAAVLPVVVLGGLGGLLGAGLVRRRAATTLPTTTVSRLTPGLLLLGGLGWATWRLLALDLLPHLPGSARWTAGATAGLLLLALCWPGGVRPRPATAWLLLLALLGPLLGLGGAHLLYPTARRERLLLEAHSPWARQVLPRLRPFWDRDHDGFSGGWGGGDCDDGDPRVHPGAVDPPGDARDQDCLGGDPPAALLEDPLGLAGLPARAPLPAGFTPYRGAVLLVIDALRLDATGVGKGPSATPELDRLATQGALFTGARSPAPGTWPAIPALLTGRLPGSLRWTGRTSPPALGPENRTLAEVLGEAGVPSHGLVSGYMKWRLFGMEQGFASYESAIPRDPPPEPRDHSSPLFTEQAQRLLARLPDQRLFLYVHYIDPHHPYVVHPGFTRGESPKERYLGELRYTEHHVARLVDGLRADPAAADLLVIVTADHGEEFREHAGQFHASQLYEESLRVPLVFLGRGIRPSVQEQPVSLVDLFPTLLDLLGVPHPPELGLQGRSLAPDLLGSPPPGADRRPLFAELGPWEKQPAAAVLEEGRHKGILRRGGDLFELYDLVPDPGERRDLADQEPERAARLLARLRALDAWRQAGR